MRKIKKNHTLQDQFDTNLIPFSRYARKVLNCEKGPFLHEFLDKPDIPSCHSSAPPPEYFPANWQQRKHFSPA